MAARFEHGDKSVTVVLSAPEVAHIRWALEFLAAVDNPKQPFGTLEYVERYEISKNLLDSGIFDDVEDF